MANQEHLAILRQGVEAWNKWRKQFPKLRPDLQEVYLSKADLRSIDFRKTNLSGAKLEDANLERANLEGANLEEINLMGSNLLGASLTGANLLGASLLGANLMEANLEGANLKRALLPENWQDVIARPSETSKPETSEGKAQPKKETVRILPAETNLARALKLDLEVPADLPKEQLIELTRKLVLEINQIYKKEGGSGLQLDTDNCKVEDLIPAEVLT